MKTYSYAGIGSRSTPPEIQDYMAMAATQLSYYGLILRSGGADGADSAFERGADPRLKEIFLPWKGFNGNPSPLSEIPPEAYSQAARFHPAWTQLQPSVQRLMARNMQQILGRQLDDPVLFILCWTDGGKFQGGTGQALRGARTFNIPVFNFGGMSLEAISEGVNQILTRKGIIP